MAASLPPPVSAPPTTAAPYVSIDKGQLDYGKYDRLGQGAFGLVVKGRLDGDRDVAIKIPIAGVRADDRQELETVAQLRHKNVLSLIGVVEPDFHLVFEFMENGSLADFVVQVPISEELGLSFMHDIACGMSYLHDMDYVHRDLAARNVLLDGRKRAKVADFGLSRFLDPDRDSYYRTQVDKPLPIRWVPKESLPSQSGAHGRFSPASDVWSFGVTVWEIWSRGAKPYTMHVDNWDAMAEIRSGGNPLTHQRPADCPVAVVQLMSRIFQVDPKKRPKFDQLKTQIADIRDGQIHAPEVVDLANGRSIASTMTTFLTKIFQVISKRRSRPSEIKAEMAKLRVSRVRSVSGESLTADYLFQGRHPPPVEGEDAGSAVALAAEILRYNTDFEVERDDICIDFSTELGSGGYGIVYKGQIANVSGNQDLTPVAVKTLRKKYMHPTLRPHVPIEAFKRLLLELKILAYIGPHENIASLVGVYPANIQNRELFLAIELCKTPLLQYLQNGTSPYWNHSVLADGNADLVRWAAEIAAGMEFLFRKRILHGDLAARNVLLSFDLRAKICDFGLARELVDDTYIKTTREALPWRWMAPESLSQMHFSTRSDVWAYGVTVWEIFSLGSVPYPDMPWSYYFVEKLIGGERLPRPTHVSDEIHSKILKCWNLEPKERPTFSELKLFFESQTQKAQTANLRANGGGDDDRKSDLGDTSPWTEKGMVWCKERLGFACAEMNEHQLSLEIKEDVCNMRSRILGEEHEDTLCAKYSLAWTYNKMQKHDAAFKLYEETLLGRKRLLGEDHEDTLDTKVHLACTCSSLGKYDKAFALHEEVYLARKRLLGEDHEDTLDTKMNLASACSSLEKYDKAFALYEEVYLAKRILLGEDHLDTLAAKFGKASTCAKLGFHELAFKLYEAVFEARARLLGEDHESTLEAKRLCK